MDRLTLANVGPRSYRSLWAHLVLAMATIALLCRVIYVELHFYVNVYLFYRQAILRRTATRRLNSMCFETKRNVSRSRWTHYMQTLLVWIMLAFLMASWSVPIAFTSFLSQVTTLSDHLTWLTWLKNIPDWLSGAIQGVLPQLVLILLNLLLPLVLNALTKLQRFSTRAETEVWLQRYYFTCLYSVNFLTVSASTSITGIAQDIVEEPVSLPTLLINNVPKASNYFISYLILQGFSITAGNLAQIISLIKWTIFSCGKKLISRQQQEAETKIPTVRLSTVLPLYTNLACIGLSYAIIAPLILVFGTLAFSMLWVASSYSFLYVSDPMYEMKGRFYPTALKQLVTGIYGIEFVLLSFFLSFRTDNGGFACIGQAVIIGFTTIMTLVYQVLLSKTFSRLLDCTDVGQEQKIPQACDSVKGNAPINISSPLCRVLHFCFGWLKLRTGLPKEIQERLRNLADRENTIIQQEQNGVSSLQKNIEEPYIQSSRKVT